jgi:hypothetical protein
MCLLWNVIFSSKLKPFAFRRRMGILIFDWRKNGKGLLGFIFVSQRASSWLVDMMEAGIYAEGGRNGVIWILEGRNSRGWRQFAGELCPLITTKEKGLALEVPKAPSSAGFTWQLFADGI